MFSCTYGLRDGIQVLVWSWSEWYVIGDSVSKDEAETNETNHAIKFDRNGRMLWTCNSYI